MIQPPPAAAKRYAKRLVVAAAIVATMCLIVAIARVGFCGSFVDGRSFSGACRRALQIKLGIPLWISMAMVVYARIRWR